MKTKERKIPVLTLDDLYISPFHFERHYDDGGRRYYLPLERKTTPTGLAVVDQLMQRWSKGLQLVEGYARLLGCRPDDVSGLLRVLTGKAVADFRTEYQQRLLEDLLRYTRLPLSEVALRSGIGSHQNLCLFTHAHYHCTPSALRRKLRRAGDVDRYRIEV